MMKGRRDKRARYMGQKVYLYKTKEQRKEQEPARELFGTNYIYIIRIGRAVLEPILT